MTYSHATEFPGFPVPDAIPADWHDSSWHNDACPSWSVAGGYLVGPSVTLFADHPDASVRECGPDVPRFSLHRHDTAAEYGAYGDSWGDMLRAVTVERLALALRAAIGDELSAADWQRMRRDNVGIAAGVCASHDYCDANMPMAAAFESVMGRPALPDDGPMSDDDMRLWNEAWAIATPAWLTATLPDDKRFDEWRMTGEPCGSLGDVVEDAQGAGRIYACGHIGTLADGRWHVVIGNLEHVGASLFAAESFLWYGHARTEWR